MKNKGYDSPLYSLDLLQPGAEPQGRDLYIPVPQGRLVTATALLRRAQRVGLARCLQAQGEALERWRRHRSAFSTFGMDDAWAASMQHWGAQLELLQQGLHQSSVELRLATTDHHRTCAASLARLADARLRAELVGLAGLPRPQTRALHATTATLQQGLQVLSDPLWRQALATVGYGDAEHAALDESVRARTSTWLARQRCEGEQARLSARSQVLRGALVGDLARLCKIAGQVLHPLEQPGLRMGRWFPHSATDKERPSDPGALAPTRG